MNELPTTGGIFVANQVAALFPEIPEQVMLADPMGRVYILGVVPERVNDQ